MDQTEATVQLDGRRHHRAYFEAIKQLYGNISNLKLCQRKKRLCGSVQIWQHYDACEAPPHWEKSPNFATAAQTSDCQA